MNNKNLQGRLRLIAATILVSGLASAILVYLAAGKDGYGGYGYEAAGGPVYSLRPEDAKAYSHDLELYGGKANLLASEFSRWFAGLWHGRQLAATIACLAVAVSLGFFVVAGRLPSEENSAAHF